MDFRGGLPSLPAPLGSHLDSVLSPLPSHRTGLPQPVSYQLFSALAETAVPRLPGLDWLPTYLLSAPCVFKYSSLSVVIEYLLVTLLLL